MNRKDVMLDLETLGVGTQAVIVSIGAVQFDPYGTGLGETFHEAIDLKSALNHGLKMDPSTILWWLEQCDAARSALVAKVKAASSLGTALHAFASFLSRVSPAGDALVWGNGADFDNALLKNAYEACNIKLPWKYNASRCYRTLRSEFGGADDYVAPTLAHDALADAVAQAKTAQRIFARLKEQESQAAAY